MGKKRDLNDEASIEYVASMNEDRKTFSLVITCNEPLTDEEYGASLMAFAQDIFDEKFSFDNEADEMFEQ